MGAWGVTAEHPGKTLSLIPSSGEFKMIAESTETKLTERLWLVLSGR